MYYHRTGSLRHVLLLTIALWSGCVRDLPLDYTPADFAAGDCVCTTDIDCETRCGGEVEL